MCLQENMGKSYINIDVCHFVNDNRHFENHIPLRLYNLVGHFQFNLSLLPVAVFK
jgi:hypothetical protein